MYATLFLHNKTVTFCSGQTCWHRSAGAQTHSVLNSWRRTARRA
jgi:hypothetical protein